MQSLVGHPVSPGYAEGTAVVFDPGVALEIPRYPIDRSEVGGEITRFQEALEHSRRELRQLERRLLAELGDSQSSIFSAHLGLLQDPQFIDGVKRRIREQLINVEQAVDEEVTALAGQLASLPNEYLRERAADIRDIGNRVLRELARGELEHGGELPPNSVIVARELLPSETIALDRRRVVAIVTEEGGENSHAAILARALGIPSVTGVAEAMSRIAPGSRLLVDGLTGKVIVTPTEVAVHAFSASRERYQDDATAAIQAENLESVTPDGVRVSLLANINRPYEAAMVAAHHLDGVGLFRTEFLYLDSPDPPGFERQSEVYRRVMAALGGRVLVIRTLDLGGDKLPAFLAHHYEANPNLGLRGLRFSLAHRDLLETQLRAILAGCDGADVRLLLPMVLGESDLRQGIEVVQSVMAQRPESPSLAIGAMIETPAALFSLNEILRLVQFISIGTNDLTQFMLAADRNAAELADDYSVLHPSVLRAIRHVVETCQAAGREVCICGEAAGDPATARLFVGLGIRQLSMSPLRAAHVRQALRHSRHDDLVQLAAKALRAESTSAVRCLLQDHLRSE